MQAPDSLACPAGPQEKSLSTVADEFSTEQAASGTDDPVAGASRGHFMERCGGS